MQIATVNQIRAARALLNWTQQDLARAAKLSLAAVNNLERDASNPRLRTLTQIQSALEMHGVEFQNGPGVRLRGEIFNVTILDQGDVYAALLEEVVNSCLAQNIPSACYMNVSDEDFIGADAEAFRSMAQRLRKHGLKDRVLVAEGDANLMFPPDITDYRWLPKELFGVTPFIVFGTKFAILLWGPPVRAVIMENSSVAVSYQQQFEFFWQQSKAPPFSGKQLYEIAEKLLPLN